MSVGELACTYAALILHDDGIPVTVIKISYTNQFVMQSTHFFIKFFNLRKYLQRLAFAGGEDCYTGEGGWCFRGVILAQPLREAV